MKKTNIKDQKLRLVFNLEKGRLNAMLKEKEKLEFDIKQIDNENS